MLKAIFLLCTLLVLTNARVMNSCVRNPGEVPVTAVLEGCSSAPCSISNSRPTDIRISFRAPRRLANMVTLATAYMNVGSIILPMQVNLGSASNTCNNLTSPRCPVNQGDLVNYTLRFQAREIPMGHNISLEVRIVDHGPMLCFMVPFRAVA